MTSGSVMRARAHLESELVGKTRSFLSTSEGRKATRTLAYFYGLAPEDLGVVFDVDTDVVYWIGPKAELPEHAPKSTAATAST